MELCAWASISDAHEEISLERDDDGLLFQHWKLNKNEGFECYYRDTAVEIRRKSILRSQKLKAVEVICRIDGFISSLHRRLKRMKQNNYRNDFHHQGGRDKNSQPRQDNRQNVVSILFLSAEIQQTTV